MRVAPCARAKSSSAVRRRNDSATPVGDWCEGVTHTICTSGGRRSTHRPSSSTGIGTSSAPAAVNGTRSGG
jgi:hypothetical protein